jgi:hypothetical protein
MFLMRGFRGDGIVLAEGDNYAKTNATAQS